MARNLAVATQFKGFDQMSRPLKNINRKLDTINRRLKKTRISAKRTSTSLVSSFGKMAVGIGGFLIAFRGFRLVKDGFLTATKAASDFFEESQKFGVVFRGVESQANSMRDTLVGAYQFSKVEATGLLASTGDLLVGIGFQRKEALRLSFAIQKLAADRASFVNLEGGAAQASRLITKALLGEREGLKTLGLSVNENTKDFKDNLKQTKKNKEFNLDMAKSMATLNIINRKSKDSFGDVGRNIGSYASNLRQAEADMSNFTVEIGEAFLPTMNILLSQLGKGAILIGAFAKENKKAISNAFITGLQFAIKGFGLLIRFTGGLVVGFKAVQFVFSGLVSLMVGQLGFVLDAFAGMGKGVAKIFGFIANVVKENFTFILRGAGLIAGVFDTELGNSIDNAVKKLSNFTTADFTKGITDAQKEARSFSKDLENFNKASSKVRDGYVSDMQAVATTTLIAQNAVNSFADDLDKARGQTVDDIQIGTAKVTPEVNTPVGNSVASPAALGSAQVNGEINVNFKDKPDDVEIQRPTSTGNSGLVLGGSG